MRTKSSYQQNSGRIEGDNVSSLRIGLLLIVTQILACRRKPNSVKDAEGITPAESVADNVSEGHLPRKFKTVFQRILLLEGKGSTSWYSLNECIENDRIYINFPPEVLACMEQNKIFNFNDGSCIPVLDASFACNFEAMADKVASLGIGTSTIFSARDNGAKIIACGEKVGATVISQWYYPGNQSTCDFDRALE